MLRNLLLLFTSKAKLLKSIKNSNYKDWEFHFDNFNRDSPKKADPLRLKSFGLEIYRENLKEIIGDYAISEEEKAELIKIKKYFGLRDGDLDKIKAKYAAKAVDELSKQKYANNDLTAGELREIEVFAHELNISKEEVAKINQRNAVEIYENALKSVLEDNIVTFQEQKQLEMLAGKLGINVEDAGINKKLTETYNYLVLVNALDNGYLPKVDYPSIVLQKNEIAHWEQGASLLVSKVVTTGYTGGSRGVSIRVMKGVYYRVGASRSHAIKQQVTEKYPGILVITSKRIVFAASEKSFAIPFTQLISFSPFSDGIGLQKNNKELLLRFNDSRISEVIFKVLTNAINQD